MLIRPLKHHERPLFAAHLKRLPPEDRRLRFAVAGAGDAWIESYVNGIKDDDLILALIDHDRVAGAVHVAFQGKVAEIGISVDSDQRANGRGGELLNQAVAYARNRLAERLYTLCLSDNRSMMGLARRAGMALHPHGGETEAFLELPPPDALTLAEEARTGLFALFHDWAEMVDAYGETLLNGLTEGDQDSTG